MAKYATPEMIEKLKKKTEIHFVQPVIDESIVIDVSKLPKFLKTDIEMWERFVRSGSQLEIQVHLTSFICSIKTAERDGDIDEETAQLIRQKYFS